MLSNYYLNILHDITNHYLRKEYKINFIDSSSHEDDNYIRIGIEIPNYQLLLITMKDDVMTLKMIFSVGNNARKEQITRYVDELKEAQYECVLLKDLFDIKYNAIAIKREVSMSSFDTSILIDIDEYLKRHKDTLDEIMDLESKWFIRKKN